MHFTLDADSDHIGLGWPTLPELVLAGSGFSWKKEYKVFFKLMEELLSLRVLSCFFHDTYGF